MARWEMGLLDWARLGIRMGMAGLGVVEILFGTWNLRDTTDIHWVSPLTLPVYWVGQGLRLLEIGPARRTSASCFPEKQE